MRSNTVIQFTYLVVFFHLLQQQGGEVLVQVGGEVFQVLREVVEDHEEVALSHVVNCVHQQVLVLHKRKKLFSESEKQ